jgi:hypothetical protein
VREKAMPRKLHEKSRRDTYSGLGVREEEEGRRGAAL